jgi:type I restriction enzyme, S subunit
VNAYPLLTLGAACELITDGSHFSPTIATEGYPYVTVRDVNNGVIDIGQCARISSEAFAQLAANGCQPRKGDVLFSKDGSIGRVAVVRDDRPFVVLSSLAILRPSQRLLLPEYLAYVLCGPAAQSQAHASQSGTAIRRVVLRSLREIRIPVPPLEEQRRIVDILEDHLSHLDAAQRYLAAADERENHLQMGLLAVGLRGQLVQEDLNEGTGQDLIRRCGGDPSAFVLEDEDRAWPVPSSWAWTRIADVFEVFVGATPSRSDKSLWGGDLAWVSSGEVAFNRITSTRETVQLAAIGNPSTRIHEPGTVMLAMIGEGKTRGQAAILGVTAAHNQNCASIRVARTPVLSEYVFYFLRERYVETRRVASGGNQPALNKGVIGRIAIPIPPLGTQRRLTAAFQEADELGDGLRRALRESGARAGLLRNSLLTAAFSGRLTDRNCDMEMVEEMAGV